MKYFLFILILFINLQAKNILLLSNVERKEIDNNHLDLMYPIKLYKYKYPCKPISSDIPNNSIFLIDYTRCQSEDYNELLDNIINKSKNTLLSIIKLPIEMEMEMEKREDSNNFFIFGKNANWEYIIKIVNAYYLDEFEKSFQEHKNSYDNYIKNEEIQKEQIKKKLGKGFSNNFFEIITYLGKNSSLSYYESFEKIYKNMLKNSEPDDIKNFLNITLSQDICSNTNGEDCANYINSKIKDMDDGYRYSSMLLINSFIENNKRDMLKAIDTLMQRRISKDIFLRRM